MEFAGPLYVRRDAGGGRGTFGLLVERRHCNAKDLCHGGMLAALADVVLGIGGLEQAGVKGFFITISLTQDFLTPVPLGSWIAAEVDLLRQTSGPCSSKAFSGCVGTRCCGRAAFSGCRGRKAEAAPFPAC